MNIHFLSDMAVNAPHLSPSAVPAKVRAGWTWHKLTPGFCTAGGTGSYSRALVSPAGVELAYVSDRADGPDALDLPAVVMSHAMVQLSVPFDQKDVAKRLGAQWIGAKKMWACAPSRIEEFKQWIHGEPVVFDILT